MFVVCLVAVASAAAIPQTLGAFERVRGRGATRYLSAQMAAARALAVGRGATVAFRFDTTRDGITFTPFLDGNRNGVLTRDIRDGIDRPLGPPIQLGDRFAHAAIVLALPTVGSAVQLSGGSNLLSFTPVGTATAGSIYVRAGDGPQYAIRVLGPTARTRIQQFDQAHHVWVDTR